MIHTEATKPDYDISKDTLEALVLEKGIIVHDIPNNDYKYVKDGAWADLENKLKSGGGFPFSNRATRSDYIRLGKLPHMRAEIHPMMGMAKVYPPYVKNSDFDTMVNLMYTNGCDGPGYRMFFFLDEDEERVLNFFLAAAETEKKVNPELRRGDSINVFGTAVAEGVGMPLDDVETIITRLRRMGLIHEGGRIHASEDLVNHNYGL